MYTKFTRNQLKAVLVAAVEDHVSGKMGIIVEKQGDCAFMVASDGMRLHVVRTSDVLGADDVIAISADFLKEILTLKPKYIRIDTENGRIIEVNGKLIPLEYFPINTKLADWRKILGFALSRKPMSETNISAKFLKDAASAIGNLRKDDGWAFDTASMLIRGEFLIMLPFPNFISVIAFVEENVALPQSWEGEWRRICGLGEGEGGQDGENGS
jgi:hypothetical protein